MLSFGCFSHICSHQLLSNSRLIGHQQNYFQPFQKNLVSVHVTSRTGHFMAGITNDHFLLLLSDMYFRWSRRRNCREWAWNLDGMQPRIPVLLEDTTQQGGTLPWTKDMAWLPMAVAAVKPASTSTLGDEEVAVPSSTKRFNPLLSQINIKWIISLALPIPPYIEPSWPFTTWAHSSVIHKQSRLTLHRNLYI